MSVRAEVMTMGSASDQRNQDDTTPPAKTWSGLPLKGLYTAADVEDVNYDRDLGDAGEFPYTRGIHPNMYRGRQWTQKLLCGFGTPADTNERLRSYVEEGANALDIIPDVPSWIGIDADHPRAQGEVGVQGVNLTSLEDIEVMLDGLPPELPLILHGTNTMASPFELGAWAVLAEKRGLPLTSLRGTLLNDPLFTFYCSWWPEGKLLVDLALKLGIDAIEYCTQSMPQVYSSYSDGYNFREMGINAPQELALTLAKAICYVDKCQERGLAIDDFAPRLSFCFSAHIDFFEEIAKIRAARRMWARIARERYGARDPRSLKLRFSVHTAGCSLVSAQPLNNIVRVAYEAMAAALGGAQAMDLCCYDEAVNIPSEEAGILSLRTQQILAYETGITSVADPLGGSYYVEGLTSALEAEAGKILAEIDEMGGIVPAIKTDWVDDLIEREALKYHQALEAGQRTVVGQNAFIMEEETQTPVDYHHTRPESEAEQVANVTRLKQTRDNWLVKDALARLQVRAAAGEKVNLMPEVIEAVRAYATVGEISGVIRQAHGFRYDPFGECEAPFSLA
jgi:methylmalonyl-CoA mutase N-terminal domain/subunit